MVCESVFLTVVNWNISNFGQVFQGLGGCNLLFFLFAWRFFSSKSELTKVWQGCLMCDHGERLLISISVTLFLHGLEERGLLVDYSLMAFFLHPSSELLESVVRYRVLTLSGGYPLSWPTTRWCTPIVTMITFTIIIASGNNSSSSIIIIVTESSRINL